jgi:hypothetical protein
LAVLLPGNDIINESIIFIFWGDFPTDHQLLPLSSFFRDDKESFIQLYSPLLYLVF